MAVQSGIQFASGLAGVESAETVARYNSEFQSYSSKLAASRVRTNASRNINAVNQDRILSNVKVAQQQDEAEAAIRVQAAASGVNGGSVEAALYQTEANESFAIAGNKRKAEQSKETLRTEVFNATMNMQSNIQHREPSIVGNLLNAASKIDVNDLQIGEALASAPTDVGTARI
jgi:hypothetical protein